MQRFQTRSPDLRLPLCLGLFLSIFLSAFLSACASLSPGSQTRSEDHAAMKIFTLTNHSGLVVELSNLGGIIRSLRVPDRDGKFADVVLGFARLEDYLNAPNHPYFGAVVGRYANRIAKGRFRIDGKLYELATNNGPNHLHGGKRGFDRVLWQVLEHDPSHITLRYLSEDGEEGYPGKLVAQVRYELSEDNELRIRYQATSDRSTHVNLSQHSYFNLAGEGRGTILDHSLQIDAARFTPIDASLIPNGELRSVAASPFDFRSPKRIGQDIERDDPQLRHGHGYDHNWVLDQRPARGHPGLHRAARVIEPSSGRVLEVFTSEPGLQFYSGNFLDGSLQGKSGKPYPRRAGFCLETQHFPDSPNHADFPSTLLRPGEIYRSETVFRFSTQH